MSTMRPSITLSAIAAVALAVPLCLVGCGGGGTTTPAPTPSPPSPHGGMNCGAGVPLCGILVLESGLGAGAYKHSQPVGHGLWPQTGSYGTSECIAPSFSKADPTLLLPCYAATSPSNPASALGFEKHEWGAHGVCAGAKDATDFFTQVCDLGSAPLAVMKKSRTAGGSVSAMATALRKAGYPVYKLGGESQIYLSVCAGDDGRWKLHTLKDFPKYCKSKSPLPTPAPTPAPTPGTGQCNSGSRGPKCSTNADCTGLKNCVRCAGSGYCTDVPLFLM